MLIKSFGEFWNPDTVDWSGRKLRGTIEPAGSTTPLDINFWNAKGIYVLHSDFRAVYVGKAVGPSSGIGSRMSSHLADRLAARWAMFSWYSTSSPRTTRGDVRAPGVRQMQPSQVVDALEALTILITDPPLNRRRETLSGAVEAVQVSGGIRMIRSYLELALNKLDAQSAQLAILGGKPTP